MDETFVPPSSDDETERLERTLQEMDESGIVPSSTKDLLPSSLERATTLEESVYKTAHDAAFYIVENKRLGYEVSHDPLTGLLTKNGLLTKVDEKITKAQAEAKAKGQPEEASAMLFLDLDHFKVVNDKHPNKHQEGDSVLKSVAKVAKKAVRHGDEGDDDIDFDLLAHGDRKDTDPARLGGDEFALFVSLAGRSDERGNPNLTPQNRLDAFQARLQLEFDAFLETRPDLKALGLGMSVGAILRRPGEKAIDMLKRSDQAMYLNKEQHHLVDGITPR
ncbi:MAG TPA: GGDEF domain-containing protein [Candidatus Saccharimonadales bacterium]|nr:GGDEF domain-containing protein [Candidatus Saccharimonadales bacterium]